MPQLNAAPQPEQQLHEIIWRHTGAASLSLHPTSRSLNSFGCMNGAHSEVVVHDMLSAWGFQEVVPHNGPC